MSLAVELSIGRKLVARMVISRLEDLSPGPLADQVHQYQVVADGELAGHVAHRYGDGAWALVQKAAALCPRSYLGSRAGLNVRACGWMPSGTAAMAGANDEITFITGIQPG
jgi:hypothetical protein